ncbi:MAG TPA: glucose 1-dehydrogenase [Kiloniellaceae bacterium]|nr:glucose 1-dehydrogenase [Kiloniellaceae bacterium]
MTFDGKTVLVTGGTRGIGRATAAAFLAAGARVAVNGRAQDSVARAIDALGGGDRLAAAPGDVGTLAGCEAAVSAALEAFGGLDVLVNSAGIYDRRPIAETDEAFWDAMMDINVKGTYFCIRAALPALRDSGGCIVHLASIAGLEGYGGSTAYCTSKGAVVNLTRSMALELAPTVRVNCVCPGVVDTDMARDVLAVDGDLSDEAEWHPMKRVATAEEVAAAILYLASPEAGFVTGVALPVDGGVTAGG